MAGETYGLTSAQRDCLLVVQELTAIDGVAPTLDEIAHEMDFASKTSPRRLLQCLHERGFIDWQPHRARSIVVRHPIPMPPEPEIVVRVGATV